MDQHATLQLTPTRRAPRAARAFAADTLEAWAVGAEVGDAVQLVVSELVTNAVLHAPATHAITLELLMASDSLRVMVSDDSTREPQRVGRQARWTDESGRGVQVIDALAARWGAELHPPRGKTVWCELRSEATTRR